MSDDMFELRKRGAKRNSKATYALLGPAPPGHAW